MLPKILRIYSKETKSCGEAKKQRVNLGGPLQRNSHKNNISQSESHKVFNRISQEMLSKMNEKGHVLKHIAKKFQNPRVERKP